MLAIIIALVVATVLGGKPTRLLVDPAPGARCACVNAGLGGHTCALAVCVYVCVCARRAEHV